MSKSLGNSIEPQDVIKQSGADILRLWVAMSDYREEIRVSKEILARVVEAYRKIRNTLRYLLGEPVRLRSGGRSRRRSTQLEEVDRYILARYGERRAADPARVRGLRLRHDLPGGERVHDRRPERVLRRRLEGSALHLRGAVARTALGADGDVS